MVRVALLIVCRMCFIACRLAGQHVIGLNFTHSITWPLDCTLTPTAADKAALVAESRVEEGTGRRREVSSVAEVEEYVGVREMEEWENTSDSSEGRRQSSDMDLSDDQEGQLFLEVGKI